VERRSGCLVAIAGFEPAVDDNRIVRRIPCDQTIRPLSQSECPMVEKG